LLLLLTWFAKIDVAYWENFKTFTIVLQLLHLQGEVHNPCTTQKKTNDKISIHVVDQNFAYNSFTSILQQ
jgi:hypothetical protein